jgi:hypothetical protein
MPFVRWGYSFDGAYRNPDSLEDSAGVYVVWCKSGDHWGVLDVAESTDVRERLATHERSECWKSYCRHGTVYYSATYTPGMQQAGRISIEHAIRDATNPPCGKR